MAYGLKYELHGKSVPFGKNWKVRISNEGYTGAQIDRNVPANPFKLKKDSAGTIRGTSLDFAIRAVDDFEFVELYTHNSRDWLIELVDNSDIVVWKGFILPEEYQEPYSPAPVTVNFTATDQLGILKNFPYAPPAEVLSQSLLVTLSDCLLNTGLYLGYEIAISIQETRQDPTRSILSELQSNPEIYRGMTCYDVVNDILSHFDADITQNEGLWMIRGMCDREKARMIYGPDCANTFTYTSVPASQTLGRYGISDVWPTGSPLALSLATSNRLLSISETYLTKASITPKAETNWGDNDFVAPSGWTNHTMAKMIKAPGTVFYFLVCEDGYKNPFGYAETIVSNVKATSEVIQFSFDFAYVIPMTTGVTDLTKEGCQLYISCRIYDPISGNTWSLTNAGWSTNPYLFVSGGYAINVPTSGNYLQTIDWKSFSVTAIGIPATGILTIQFGNPHAWGWVGSHSYGTSYWGAAYKNVIFNIYDSGKLNPSGLQYNIALNNSTKAAKKEFKWTGGDVPIRDNGFLQFMALWSVGGTDTQTGLYTTDDLTTPMSLIDVISEQNASDNRRAKQYLKGDIRGENLRFESVYQHSFPTTRKFEILEATYDLCADKANVTLLEILDFEAQTFVLTVGDYTGTPYTGSGSASIIGFETTTPVPAPPVYAKAIKMTLGFIADANPSILAYNLTYFSTFGDYPSVRIFIWDGISGHDELGIKPKFTLVGNLLDSIVYDLGTPQTGFIILS